MALGEDVAGHGNEHKPQDYFSSALNVEQTEGK